MAPMEKIRKYHHCPKEIVERGSLKGKERKTMKEMRTLRKEREMSLWFSILRWKKLLESPLPERDLKGKGKKNNQRDANA